MESELRFGNKYFELYWQIKGNMNTINLKNQNVNPLSTFIYDKSTKVIRITKLMVAVNLLVINKLRALLQYYRILLLW